MVWVSSLGDQLEERESFWRSGVVGTEGLLSHSTASWGRVGEGGWWEARGARKGTGERQGREDRTSKKTSPKNTVTPQKPPRSLTGRFVLFFSFHFGLS